MPRTGSAKLERKHLFNEHDRNMEIPDGNVKIGQQVFKNNCSGCHSLDVNFMAPKLRNIFGKKAGNQIGFKYYSLRNRSMGHRWSKQQLFIMLGDPQSYFGLDSGMSFVGLPDVFQRASVIEYLHYLKMQDPRSKLKPEWYM